MSYRFLSLSYRIISDEKILFKYIEFNKYLPNIYYMSAPELSIVAYN